jgi:hypothetical protein
MFDKKILIDLLESQLDKSIIEEAYTEKNYYFKIKFSAYEVGVVESKPNRDNNNNHNDYPKKSMFYDDCEMHVEEEENNKCFIYFNSIKEEISFDEFINIKKSLKNKKDNDDKKLKEQRTSDDKWLLEKVFIAKNNSESRKILIEKYE